MTVVLYSKRLCSKSKRSFPNKTKWTCSSRRIALELGLSESDEVRYVVRGNRSLRRLGLGPLAAGQTIKRDMWSQLSSDRVSLFHLVAEEFEQGTPFVQP